MSAVILIVLPLTVPKLFGCEIYGILTESMRPEYPPGCVVYIKKADASEIQKGDAITYKMGTNTDLETTHRVVKVDNEKQQFITKGDANRSVDADPVSFDRLIGKVVFKLPLLGSISAYLHTTVGMAVCAAIFVTAMILWVLADKMKSKESVK